MLVDTHLMAVFQDSWVSRFQIVSFLDCIGAKDDGGGGDNWSCETLYYPTLSFSLILCLSLSLSLPLSLPLPVHFNGHFPGERYQNVSIPDFIGVKGAEGSGSNCSYKTCKAPVKMLPPTNQHPVFYRLDALPVTQPTASKHWRETMHCPTGRHYSICCHGEIVSIWRWELGRTLTGCLWSWKVMEFRKTIFQAWKALKGWKVIENSKDHGKSWKMMTMLWNFYYCTEQFIYKVKYYYELFYLFNNGTTSRWNCHY